MCVQKACVFLSTRAKQLTAELKTYHALKRVAEAKLQRLRMVQRREQKEEEEWHIKELYDELHGLDRLGHSTANVELQTEAQIGHTNKSKLPSAQSKLLKGQTVMEHAQKREMAGFDAKVSEIQQQLEEIKAQKANGEKRQH